jgi:hypothetical protein
LQQTFNNIIGNDAPVIDAAQVREDAVQAAQRSINIASRLRERN